MTDASQGQGDFPLWTRRSYDGWRNTSWRFGHNRVLNDTGVSGISATSHRNISIAYNTIIENANRRLGPDYLFGNDVSNKLNGNGGNDVLDGHGATTSTPAAPARTSSGSARSAATTRSPTSPPESTRSV